MKEFINRIQIAPVSDISSISGTTITMKQDRTIDSIFPSGDITPEEKDSEKSGNRYYSQNLKIVCDRLATTLYNRYRKRKVVIKLFDDQDEEFLLGNIKFPARCSMLRNLTQDILNVTCENPDPLVP